MERTSKSSPKSGVALNHGSAYCTKRRPGKEEKKPPACGAPVRGWTKGEVGVAGQIVPLPRRKDARWIGMRWILRRITLSPPLSRSRWRIASLERVRHCGVCRGPSASEDDRQHLLCLRHQAVSSPPPEAASRIMMGQPQTGEHSGVAGTPVCIRNGGKSFYGSSPSQPLVSDRGSQVYEMQSCCVDHSHNMTDRSPRVRRERTRKDLDSSSGFSSTVRLEDVASGPLCSVGGLLGGKRSFTIPRIATPLASAASGSP